MERSSRHVDVLAGYPGWVEDVSCKDKIAYSCHSFGIITLTLYHDIQYLPFL